MVVQHRDHHHQLLYITAVPRLPWLSVVCMRLRKPIPPPEVTDVTDSPCRQTDVRLLAIPEGYGMILSDACSHKSAKTQTNGFRAGKNPKRTDAAAAMVIQRWRRQLAQARLEMVRAQQEAARRRWAVDKLHSAYAKRWRFGVAACRERRLRLEEDEVREVLES